MPVVQEQFYEKTETAALVNDITGFGRCSITVELPIVSALKVEACPFPTALLSVHTAFPNPFIRDDIHHAALYGELEGTRGGI